MPRTPASAAIPEETYTLNTEILKPIPLSAEYNRGGKNRLRYRAFVAVGDNQRKIVGRVPGALPCLWFSQLCKPAVFFAIF